MNLEMNGNVKLVAEFMQAEIPAAELVAVATELARLAPILWGEYRAVNVKGLRLAPEPLVGGND